jgi:hypothetical protein
MIGLKRVSARNERRFVAVDLVITVTRQENKGESHDAKSHSQ